MRSSIQQPSPTIYFNPASTTKCSHPKFNSMKTFSFI